MSSRSKSSSSSLKRTFRKSSDSDDSNHRKRKKKSSSSREITEEQITEYLTKKAQRKAIKVAKKLKENSVSGYANDSNPFGDSNLNQKFVWGKKIEKDVSQGVPLDTFSAKAEKKRQKERMAEIEKVKKRREERAHEKAQHEEEIAMLARQRARAEYQDWEKKKEEFHFNQSKVRSEIRLREGRIKPIDVLSKHINVSDDLDIELSEPYMVFKGLTGKEMEELCEDIKMRLDMDRETQMHIDYWEALLVVCNWELAEARKKDALDRARVRGGSLLQRFLRKKEACSLVSKQMLGINWRGRDQIESKMSSGTAEVVEIWEAALKRLPIYEAKARLNEIHAKMLRNHLHHLERPLEDDDELAASHSLSPIEEESEHEMKDPAEISPENVFKEEAEDDAGSFSPELLHGDDNEEAIDPEEDKAILEMKRMAVIEEQKRQVEEAMAVKPPPPEDTFELKAMKAMGASGGMRCSIKLCC